MDYDTDDTADTAAQTEDGRRKPRIALMGEFSAGKSTLSNLLLGADPLPVKVTATRLPPILIAQGDGPAICECHDGSSFEIAPEEIEGVDLDKVRMVRLFLDSDILGLCDLIDMPGISDPNMASSVWQDVVGEADHVIWCTHAMQAWRQSEAAAWAMIRDGFGTNDLLLLTRMDKIMSDRDRKRILARVRAETSGQFSDLFAVSLTEALAAGEDEARWRASGADVFVDRLIEILLTPGSEARGTYEGKSAKPDKAAEAAAAQSQPEPSGPRVVPVRVSSGTVAPRPRPAAQDREAILGSLALDTLPGEAG